MVLWVKRRGVGGVCVCGWHDRAVCVCCSGWRLNRRGVVPAAKALRPRRRSPPPQKTPLPAPQTLPRPRTPPSAPQTVPVPNVTSPTRREQPRPQRNPRPHHRPAHPPSPQHPGPAGGQNARKPPRSAAPKRHRQGPWNAPAARGNTVPQLGAANKDRGTTRTGSVQAASDTTRRKRGAALTALKPPSAPSRTGGGRGVSGARLGGCVRGVGVGCAGCVRACAGCVRVCRGRVAGVSGVCWRGVSGVRCARLDGSSVPRGLRPPPSPGRSLLRVSSTRVVPYFVCRFPRGPLGTSRAERELRALLFACLPSLFSASCLFVCPQGPALPSPGDVFLFSPGKQTDTDARLLFAVRAARRFYSPSPSPPHRSARNYSSTHATPNFSTAPHRSTRNSKFHPPAKNTPPPLGDPAHGPEWMSGVHLGGCALGRRLCFALRGCGPVALGCRVVFHGLLDCAAPRRR